MKVMAMEQGPGLPMNQLWNLELVRCVHMHVFVLLMKLAVLTAVWYVN